MEILIKDGVKYLQTDFHGKENEFEKVVFTQYKHLFGDNAILFKKKKIESVFGTATIPDAFVIDFEKEKWFIIEVEISNHDVRSHVAVQLMKFSEAHNNLQTRKQLVKAFDDEIKNDPFKIALLVANGKTQPYKTISEIIDREPELVIIIEQEHKELISVFNSFTFKTKINVFRTFIREGLELGEAIYQIEPITKAASVHHIVTKPTLKTKITSLPTNGQQSEKKRGRGNRDGLTDYIIPVVKLIKSGTPHSKAFGQIAEYLGVEKSTAYAQCTTVLKITVPEFVELVNSGKLKNFLKTTKFSNRVEEIDRQL